jgi:biopolymer transport protein ExbD
MGMSAGSGSKEINVTPLIDVLLVLLIIFMVMLPVVMRMETVEVPPKSPPEAIPTVEPVVLKINADSSVTIDELDTVAYQDLHARIGERVRGAKQVFVDFGDGVPWSEVLHTVDTLRGFATDGAHDDIKIAVRVREDLQVGQ